MLSLASQPAAAINGRSKFTGYKIHRTVISLITLFYIFTYLVPLGARPMARPDEFRYAEIPREMLASGDWITPRLNGVRYFEKPALGYQLTALSFAVFGENAWALRLPSALAVLLTAVFIYYLLMCELRDPLLPGMATMIYLCCGMVYGVGTFAVMDSLLTAALTLSIGGFYLACRSDRPPVIAASLIFAGVWTGAAFLVKGLLAFAVPAIVLTPFLLWQRNWRQLFMYPYLVLLAAVMVALPWSWEIHQAEPDFWRYFLVEEHFKRFTGSTYDRGPEPFWYYLPILLATVMPSGLLAISGAAGISRKWLQRPLTRLLLCWAILPFVLFSVSSCKLGTYILPCFPPLAILLALAVRRVMLTQPKRHQRITGTLLQCAGWLLLAGAILAAATLTVWLRLPGLPPLFEEFPVWAYAALAGAALLGTLMMYHAKFHRWQCTVVLLAAAVPVIICGQQALPTAALGNKLPESGLSFCLQTLAPTANDLVIVDRNTTAPAAWLLKRDDLIVLGKPGELAYGFANYPQYAARHYGANELPQLLSRPRPGQIFWITTRKLRNEDFPQGRPLPEMVMCNGITVAKF